MQEKNTKLLNLINALLKYTSFKVYKKLFNNNRGVEN